MGGFLACILAGAAMSIQGVMNTRLSEHIGTMETNAFVQCVAAVLSLLVLVFWRTGSFAALGAAPKYCWFGGVLALAITVTVMLGMGRLGPTLAVATILIAQLSAAAAIDAFGIMGTEKLAFGWSKWAGLALMTGGVLLFKMTRDGETGQRDPLRWALVGRAVARCSARAEPSGIFSAAHVAGENDWNFFAPAGANSARLFTDQTDQNEAASIARRLIFCFSYRPMLARKSAMPEDLMNAKIDAKS